MSNNNQFQPYRYQQSGSDQHASQSGLNISSAGLSGRQAVYSGVSPNPLVRLLRRPAFATLVLLLGAVTVAVVVMMGTSGDSSDGDVPIVKADARPIREAPTEIGGLQIPNADSTIYQTARLDELNEPAPVENLLADESAVSRMEAFAEEAKAMMDKVPSQPLEANAATITIDENNSVSVTKPAEAEQVAVSILQEISPVAGGEAQAKVSGSDSVAAASSSSVVPAAKPVVKSAKPKPAEGVSGGFPAGASPDTLAFVRSVLDKKDDAPVDTVAKADAAAATVAKKVVAIQPAAGTPADAKISISPGEYYVQLASVKSRDGAYGEWTKLKKSFSNALDGADYRVKQADLGERGVFYRIQAGPMSKASAGAVCDSIKARKPGGCLVTR